MESAVVEQWRIIPGYDRYEVSNTGLVRRLLTKRILAKGHTKGGQLHARLGRASSIYIHRAVLLAFVGPCPDGQRAMHLDGDPSNNNLDNLAWAPRTESARSGTRHQKWTERGVLRASNGYLVMRLGRTHPLADPNGYCRVHVVVWASAGKPWPVAGQHIHHINGDRDDNRIENLTMLSNSEHNKLHARQRRQRLDGHRCSAPCLPWAQGEGRV